MKRFAIALTVLFVALSINAQLMYRISSDTLEKPSFVLGTYHLAPASFADSIPGVEEAFSIVEQVCGELDMRSLQEPGNAAQLIEAMKLPDGESLRDILSEDELKRLNAYMYGILGTNLDNPMVDAQLSKFTPAALSTQLQVMQYSKITPGYNPAAPIDVYFQMEAQKQGKPVIGLETIEMQISVLYKGTSIERQKEQLMCMVDNPEYYVELMKSIVDAYFKQDMGELSAAADERLGNICDSTPEEENLLIYNRNTDWAEKIPMIINDKPTLFVVGALHLPGERGLLELLKAKGYKIEAVK